MKYINEIILGNNLNILPTLPSEKFNCCVTSPPYFGLRDYGIEPVIWDEDKNCKHEWDNKTITLKHKSGETNPGKESWYKDKGASDDKGNCFCLKCGAWRGSLGLEPTIELYIKHLCDIFDQVKRALRKDGTCFVNLGDSYAGSGKGIGTDRSKCKESYSDNDIKKSNWQDISILSKSLCLIPQRFVIEMVNRGWIARNVLIWHKTNCMPSSANDRFTVDFEDVFFFTKNNKAIFWTNEKTLECIDKQPPGTKGIEGKDWEWRPCLICQDNSEIICSRCKGSGKVKYSFWTGHDYWFEQAFEAHTSTRWGGTNDSKCKDGEYALPNYKPGVRSHKNDYSPQGRNKRAVWTIPTKPFPEAHFAVYPETLIEPMIQAGCPRYVYKKCGKARVKIYEGKSENAFNIGARDTREGRFKEKWGTTQKTRPHYEKYQGDKEFAGEGRKFIGYTDCGCNAGFEGGIVLDPFGGVGTTGKVAKKQGKRYIIIEIKKEYIDMANKGIRRIPELLF